ncbi:MAG: hypothetical protein QW303_08875, partial [Nitrososphaerota archaeon]
FSYYISKEVLNLKAIIFMIVEDINNPISKPQRCYKEYVERIIPTINTNGCIFCCNVKNAYVMWANGCFTTT